MKHERILSVDCNTGLESIIGVYTLGGEIVQEWGKDGWEEVNETAVQNQKSNYFNWDWLNK